MNAKAALAAETSTGRKPLIKFFQLLKLFHAMRNGRPGSFSLDQVLEKLRRPAALASRKKCQKSCSSGESELVFLVTANTTAGEGVPL
jgi:hypothetical protein